MNEWTQNGAPPLICDDIAVRYLFTYNQTLTK